MRATLQMLLPKELNQKLTYYLLLAFAFAFPFGNIYGTVIIILLSVLWILNGKLLIKIKSAFANPFFLSFTSLFFLQIPGLLITNDFERAFYLIRLNASMFVLPLLFVTYATSEIKINLKNILISFIAGCLTASFISILLAFINFFESGDKGVFFYDRLAQHLYHPGFLSIQMSLCLIVLILDISRVNILFNSFSFKTLKLVLAGWLVIYIALLSSKIGLIALLLIIIASVIYGFIKIKNPLIRAGIFLIPFFVVFIFLNSSIDVRIKSALQSINSTENLSQNEESTALRITALKTTIELIKNNSLLGVGTGDVWPDLRRYYFVEGNKACLKEKVIPHNQYLNSFAKHGIIGIAVLLFLLFFPLIKSFKQKQWLSFVFMILIILNCGVEDVFEVQNGVVFTSFFYSYFFLFYNKLTTEL